MTRIALVIKIEKLDDNHAEVKLERLAADNDDFTGPVATPFWALMAAAEYITHVVAQSSGLGYEAALEKIAQGAMTCRHREIEDG